MKTTLCFIIILGAVLIAVGVTWIIIFNIEEHKLIEKYAKNNLLEYQDSDMVPEKVARQFIMDGIQMILKKTLTNILIPSIVIVFGILVIVFTLKFAK